MYVRFGAAVTQAKVVERGTLGVTRGVNKALLKEEASKGSTRITFKGGVSGVTAFNANEYAGGFLLINDADGEGYAYRIQSHDAYTTNSSDEGEILLDEPLVEALTTSSEVSLVYNEFSELTAANSEADDAVGVTLSDVADDHYGWIQTKGVAAVVSGGNLTQGGRVMVNSSTAGTVVNYAGTSTAHVVSRQTVGKVVVTRPSGETALIQLTL